MKPKILDLAIRQGEWGLVWLGRRYRPPESARPTQPILGGGDRTGLPHRLDGGQLYSLGGTTINVPRHGTVDVHQPARVLVLAAPATLTGGGHAPIEVPPGAWLVLCQQDGDEEERRNVQD